MEQAALKPDGRSSVGLATHRGRKFRIPRETLELEVRERLNVPDVYDDALKTLLFCPYIFRKVVKLNN
jgi:hypothetical protein